MTNVRMVTVGRDEGDTRLDRWFKRHYPELSHGRLEKLLRTGQVRVDGGRVKAAHRLEPGMVIRIPPIQTQAAPPSSAALRPELKKADIEALQQRVLYRDADILAIDKPAGLAVQGGTGLSKHLDGMLDALQFDAAERPRLVHRLDKDTSGVLLLARNVAAARWLAEAFRNRATQKIYWAAVAGVPKPRRGKIDSPIAKQDDDEKMQQDEEGGKAAVTFYAVVENAGARAAWLILSPQTGRTHQLRVHCALLGTPILGDGKYGGVKARIDGLEERRKLHLHARSLHLVKPNGTAIDIDAPLPPHMRETWDFFGFDESQAASVMADLDI